MDAGAFDFSALLLAIFVSLAITVAFFAAERRTRRFAWITAGVLITALVTVGLIDLQRASPRETHLATVFFAGVVPVLGALGLARATAPMRPYFRWPLVFLATLVLLFVALLFGATMVPRYL
jgi:hypothetical protein